MKSASHIDLLRALEVFAAVADTGSVTKAAQMLRVTQSAVSQQLRQLETELDISLFDRATRPLRLTPSGVALHQQAFDMLQHAERLRAEVRQTANGPLKHLRLAVFSTLARTLVPAVLQAVADGELAVKTASLMRGVTAYSGAELLQREVDVVITSNALYELEGLERHDLIGERFILAVPRSVEVGPADVNLRQLAARLPLVRYAQRTEAGRLIEQHLRRQRLRLPHTYSFDNPEDLLTMIGMGLGWTITAPTHAVHALSASASARDQVRLLALPPPVLSRSITLVARTGELGDLPARIADICRSALHRSYLDDARTVLGDLSDNLSII